MVTRYKNIKSFLFLFTLLISSISSLQIKGTSSLTGVDYDNSLGYGKVQVTEAFERQNFRLDFDGEVPRSVNYIRVDCHADSAMPTPILHFSETDDTCTSDRQQLVRNPNSDTVTLWLKTEEFQEGDLFINVQILTKDKADYTLTFTGKQQIEMGPNFSYSYLVGKGNKDMVFYADVSEETPDSLTFYAVGSSSASISVDDADKAAKFSMGSAVTMKPKTENKSQYSFRVTASEGDYITVGLSNVKEAKTEGNVLQPNGNEVSGYLVRNILNDQCFEMGDLEERYKSKKIYITGRFYNKIAEVYIRDSSFKEIEEYTKTVRDGFYTLALTTSGKKNSVCVRFPEEGYANLKNIPFSLSVTEPTYNKEYNWYNPQVMGVVYRRIIPKGSVHFFSSLTLPKNKRITFNLKTKKGFPKMYSGRCRDYPRCAEDNVVNSLNAPRKINRMYTFSYNDIDDKTPLINERYVIVAKCLDDDSENSDVCEFDTSFVSTNDEPNLIENETLGQFALKSEKGAFIIPLEGDENVRTINIDIMVESGDINFNLKSPGLSELNYQKYYLSNKMYFKIQTADNDVIKQLRVEYVATLNSYYTIIWSANRRNDGGTAFRDYIASGSSYLVDIDPTTYFKRKIIRLQNLRYKDSKPFLANFYSLNCEFTITRGNKPIKFFDGYAQEIVTASDSKYKSKYYDYNITITEPDLSNYNHKMCMLYVAGMETATDKIDTEIVTAENIEQQVIFEDGFEEVRFLYPNPDVSKDLVLKVNVIDISVYEVKVIAETRTIDTYEISRTQIIHLPSSIFDRECPENNVCAIIIQVKLKTKLVDTNPMVEVILRPILNTPTYLQKGSAKKDFVCGRRFYYLYTDIGKNEEGEILVNFMRGNGEVYAKVVRKDQTSVDEEANWRDIYRMPSKDWEDSLGYDYFNKKFKIKTENTADCIEGCYLLISVQLEEGDEYVQDHKFYPFSILTRVTPANRAYTDIPKVVIQANEYIIGNVEVAENERISEFYEIWLPHDSLTVELDWQSEVAGLYVNLGGTRPTTKNADFKLVPNGADSILTLYKQEILDRATQKQIPIPYKGTIQDLNLVIGVWTDKTDSIGSEPYSLRVHQPMENDIDIVEISSSQKVLCRPVTTGDDSFRCLFMVVYDDNENIDGLLAYGASVDKSATNYMYAKFVDKKIYDQYDARLLQTNIPTTESAEYNSRTDGVNYLYIDRASSTKYLYVSVVSDKESDVMFITSYGSTASVVTPNPSTEEIASIKPGSDLSYEFKTNNDVLVNFVCLGGEGDIYWEKNPDAVYHLKGAGDRLTITSGKDVLDKKAGKLVIKNNKQSNKMDDPGFIYYVQYHLRDPAINFDEVYAGSSIEYSYKDTDLPIYLYNKISNSASDVNIAVRILNAETDNKTNEYVESPFKFNAPLVKENMIYLAKKNPELRPSYEKAVAGFYDVPLNIAQVSLSIYDLALFNIRNSDNPTVYFGLEKSDLYNITYKKLDLEVQVSKSNDLIPPLENTYIYGKVSTYTERNLYKLKVNKNSKIMKLHVSVNSVAIGYLISDSSDSEKNMTLSCTRGNGKDIITINIPTGKDYLYILFYVKDKDKAKDRRINNYCFKYKTGEDANILTAYKMKDNNRNVKFTDNANGNVTDIKAVFKKVEAGANAKVTYFLKVVPNITHAYLESYDTIAVCESPAYVAKTTEVKDELTLELKNVPAEWVYLEVIASIVDGDNYEYETYKGDYHLRPAPDDGSGGGVDTVVFLVVGGILLLLVIGLIIVVIVFKNKNKTLLNQVKHVSFQKTNSNTDPNLLLNKQQQQTEGEPA